MALNFPANPAVGDIYRNEGASFQWNGVVWVSLGSSANLGVPVGTVAYFAGNSAPDGWLHCNNQPVTTLYPKLRAYLLAEGSPFGVSGADPRVPELRGEFIRGHVAGRTGVDAGRVFGSAQGDQNKAHIHTFTRYNNNAFVPNSGSITVGHLGQNGQALPVLNTGSEGGNEARPRNVALLPCIKAFDAVSTTG